MSVSNNITKPEPKYRKPLNPHQQEIIHLLYRFRFATTQLIARYQGKQSGMAVFNRMRVLCEQEYIGRNFDSSYRLRGQSASYYLLPKALKLLKEDPDYDRKVLHAIYKDKQASDKFINRCLAIFQIHSDLSAFYGKYFDLFTKSELGEFDYFPNPLPDAYITLKSSSKGRTKHFLLLFCDEATPLFAYIKRVKQIIEHIESGEWDEAPISRYPTILLICESLKQQKLLQGRIGKTVQDEGVDEPGFYLTTKSALVGLGEHDTVWQLATDPITMRSLRQI